MGKAAVLTAASAAIGGSAISSVSKWQPRLSQDEQAELNFINYQLGFFGKARVEYIDGKWCVVDYLGNPCARESFEDAIDLGWGYEAAYDLDFDGIFAGR